MSLTLGSLLSLAWSSARKYAMPILVGAVVLGTIASLMQSAVGARVQYTMRGVFSNMGVSPDRMRELTDRMARGDASAREEMQEMLKRMGGDSSGMPDDRTGEIFFKQMMGAGRSLGPAVGLGFLVFLVLTLLSTVYFLLIPVMKTSDLGALIARVPGLFFPMIGLWIWVGIRTFLWIPLLLLPVSIFFPPLFVFVFLAAIVLGLVLGPRFALSPVILVSEGKGIRESADLSYRRTAGYWGKVVGNLIVMGLIGGLAMAVIGIIATMFGGPSSLVAIWVRSIGSYLISAYYAVFLVLLAGTIKEHPHTGISASA